MLENSVDRHNENVLKSSSLEKTMEWIRCFASSSLLNMLLGLAVASARAKRSRAQIATEIKSRGLIPCLINSEDLQLLRLC